MFSAGAGSSVTVQVPSPLSAATGPPFGSQLHQGPVRRTALAPEAETVIATPEGVTSPSVEPSVPPVLSPGRLPYGVTSATTAESVSTGYG